MEENVNKEPVLEPIETPQAETEETATDTVVPTDTVEATTETEETATETVEAATETEEAATETDAQAEETAVPQTKEGILECLKSIAESDEEIDRQTVDSLKSHFYRILKTESEAAYKQYVDEGGDPEAYEPIIDPTEQQFKDLFAIVRQKRAEQHEALEHLKEENYLKKLQIIEKIKAMLETPDDVNKEYSTFRELQTEWNSLKEVPAEKATELWKTYQVNVEKFYDTLKLNNEFRAYDFKKNLEKKLALCEAAEHLAEEKNVVEAFRQLQNLHQQFRETGPVSRELREEVWQRFKAASTIINKRHQDYFESRKQEENDNLDQKTAICEIIEGYDLDSLKSYADWTSMTEQVTALQAKWKTIGFAPQKMNQKIYERFRAACDNFFSRKSEFFKTIRESQNENLKLKRDLVAQAEALRESQEWSATTNALVALQKQWKTIGAVPRKYSDDLWSRFNAACDAFFEAKKAATSSTHSEQTENLQKKQAIVDRLAAIVPEETADLRQQLKDAQAEWNEIGHVPFKEKDKVYKALRVQMDRLYDYLGTTASRQRVERFKSNLSGGNGAGMRDKLVRQAEILEQEIKTYENNLGFLNLSKGSKSGGLVDELNHKVEKLRTDLREIKEKIKILDSAEPAE